MTPPEKSPTGKVGFEPVSAALEVDTYPSSDRGGPLLYRQPYCPFSYMSQRRPSVLEAALQPLLLHVTETALCYTGSLTAPSPTCYRDGPLLYRQPYCPFSYMLQRRPSVIQAALLPLLLHVTETALCFRGSLTARSPTYYRDGPLLYRQPYCPFSYMLQRRPSVLEAALLLILLHVYRDGPLLYRQPYCSFSYMLQRRPSV